MFMNPQKITKTSIPIKVVTWDPWYLRSQNFHILFPVTSNAYNHIFMTKKVIENITNINKIWSIYQLIIFHKKSQKYPIHTLFTNLVFQKYHVYKSCNSRSYSNILCLNNIFFTNPLLEELLVLDPKNILFTNPMFHKHIIRRSYAQRTSHKKPPLQQWGSPKLL